MSETAWKTVAFAPARAGWRAQFDDGDNRWTEPVAGWLTQENEHARRFVAAVASDAGELVPVTDWLGAPITLAGIYGPGQALPIPDLDDDL